MDARPITTKEKWKRYGSSNYHRSPAMERLRGGVGMLQYYTIVRVGRTRALSRRGRVAARGGRRCRGKALRRHAYPRLARARPEQDILLRAAWTRNGRSCLTCANGAA